MLKQDEHSPFNQALDALLVGQSISREGAESALSEWLDGSVPELDAMRFLTALTKKGETADEIAGFVECLSQRAVQVTTGIDAVVDVCGTGGDRSGSFNISTTVAFVLAGVGVPIAKHGNRSVSSRSGSFDVLEALGVSFSDSPKLAIENLKTHGITFLFAPYFHPGMSQVSVVRKLLRFPTVFNIIGPLLNPVKEVKRQVIGVSKRPHMEILEEVAKNRNAVEVLIVRGQDGLDEISLSGPTDVSHLKNGIITHYEVSPEDFGISRFPKDALLGGNASENASILISILRGEKGPKRDCVLMNAAAGLVVAGKVQDFMEGMEVASESIDSGKSFQVLKNLLEARS